MAPAAAWLLGEALALVVAEWFLVPKFDAFGRDAEARPVRRTRHVAHGETQRRGGHRFFKFPIALHRLGLFGGPGTELAETGTGREIGIGLGVGHRRDGALDADLALDFDPMKTDRRAGELAELGGLGAVEVGVENEAAFIDALEQHHANLGKPALIDGGERHAGGLGAFGADGFVHPRFEVGDGLDVFGSGHGERSQDMESGVKVQRLCSLVAVDFPRACTSAGVKARPSTMAKKVENTPEQQAAAPKWLSGFFLTLCCLVLIAAPWWLGSEGLEAQQFLLAGSVLVAMLGLAVRLSGAVSPGAGKAWRVQRWVLALGSLFLVIQGVRIYNPSHVVTMIGSGWGVQGLSPTPWLPQSLVAPFDGVEGDYLPFRNSARYLLIFSAAWFYALGLALGLTERGKVNVWLGVAAANGLTMAAVSVLHRLSGEPLTLWKFRTVFDFSGGSPVFFYKNHNGGYLVAMMASILAVAAMQKQKGWRLALELSAGLAWLATMLVNCRFAAAWGLVVSVVYLMLRRSDEPTESRVKRSAWPRVLVVALVLVVVGLGLTQLGGGRFLARFDELKQDPMSFVQGGSFRTMLREIGWEMWSDRPVWGWGGGAYLYLFNGYHQRVPEFAAHIYREQPDRNRFFMVYADSDWVEFLVEYGVVGVGLMVAALGICVVIWLKAKAWRDTTLACVMMAVAGLVLHGFLDHTLRNPALLMLLGALMVVGLRLSARLERR